MSIWNLNFRLDVWQSILIIIIFWSVYISNGKGVVSQNAILIAWFSKTTTILIVIWQLGLRISSKVQASHNYDFVFLTDHNFTQLGYLQSNAIKIKCH